MAVRRELYYSKSPKDFSDAIVLRVPLSAPGIHHKYGTNPFGETRTLISKLRGLKSTYGYTEPYARRVHDGCTYGLMNIFVTDNADAMYIGFIHNNPVTIVHIWPSGMIFTTVVISDIRDL